MNKQNRYLTLKSRGCIRFAQILTILALMSHGPKSQGQEPWRWTNVDRVIAIGDVHGAYSELVRLLQQVAVIDHDHHWIAGQSHLVSTGDLIDRGPDSRKVLDLMMGLQAEALAAGGRVHVLLGNHELMNLTGDLRYVPAADFQAYANEEAPELREAAWQRFSNGDRGQQTDPTALRADFERHYPPGFFGHRTAFSPAGKYGAWLKALPSIIVINDMAYVHGGLPAWLRDRSLPAINGDLQHELDDFLIARQSLIDAGFVFIEKSEDETFDIAHRLATAEAMDPPASVKAAAGRLNDLQNAKLFSPDSPHWYRGSATCNELIERSRLEDVLRGLKAASVVVGHTPTRSRRVSSRMGGRVLLIDTAMVAAAQKGRAAALVIEDGLVRAAYAGEPGQVAVVAESPLVGMNKAGLSRKQLESFLMDADVVSSKPIPDGITRPKKLRLHLDGAELKAVFKYMDLDADRRSGGRTRYKEADSYRYDIAAYRLDRLLGLNMVPVTVLREVDGKTGAVQLWLDDTMNKREIVAQDIEAVPTCPIVEQFQLMYAFDFLISNDDRNQTNMLYAKSDWRLYLIDHSRAFRNRTGWPKYYNSKTDLTLSPEFLKRLAALDEETLKRELGDVLHPSQISYLLKRRDKLLKNYGSRGITTEDIAVH